MADETRKLEWEDQDDDEFGLLAKVEHGCLDVEIHDGIEGVRFSIECDADDVNQAKRAVHAAVEAMRAVLNAVGGEGR